ncbi:MAG: site-specific integrase [Candidatus Omnitrophica bacterium]|nr:site-specific integrase [Candidatus Omnitrophota bacterium]
MAEDDIYGNKRHYENFKQNIRYLTLPPDVYLKVVLRDPIIPLRGSRRKYYCLNKANLSYFYQMVEYLEAKDMSYIARMRILRDILFICHHVPKNLEECTREDINKLMAHAHRSYKTPSSKNHFIKHLRYIWKILFPEKDSHGRTEDTITPYPVRHVSPSIDKSRQKIRKDKFTTQELQNIISYFGKDPRMQAYLTLALESLGRPQELLYLRIGNVEMHDNYAKIFLSEHGKEGTGILQCIDSYPYLLKWLNQHPLKNNPQAFLFVNTGTTNTLEQFKPTNINKMLAKAVKDLRINKPITCYSLKRNGVTLRRLRGESDMEIQHAARWTSTQVLKTYDQSSQNEALKLQLQKRGLIPVATDNNPLTNKKCAFCNTVAGSTDITCPQCKRPLDRKHVIEETKKDEQIQNLKETVSQFTKQISTMKQEILQDLAKEILHNQQGYRPDNREDTGNFSSKSSSKTPVSDLPLETSRFKAL